MLIDVTYFNNGLFLVLYHNHDIGYIQLYRETEKEKLREIEDYDLQQKMTLLNGIYILKIKKMLSSFFFSHKSCQRIQYKKDDFKNRPIFRIRVNLIAGWLVAPQQSQLSLQINNHKLQQNFNPKIC